MMILDIDDKWFNEEELTRTPERWKGIMEEWEGKHDFTFRTFPNPGYDEIILLRDVDFASLCSHHLLPFTGKAHVGYLPEDRICGISKLARVVDKYASRPQVQERMTEQIAQFIMDELEPRGCMVVVEGQHECMRIRGVSKPNSVMVTSAIRGEFHRKPHLKDEFLRLIGM